jgi:hypothetical protein
MKKLFTFILLASFSGLLAQTTQQFTASGTWTAPVGVTSVTVECWGGGGGGSYVQKVSITVVPGTTYIITVGGGGSGGSAGTGSGTPGGKSEFSGGAVTAVTASGGTPGSGGNSQRNAGVGGVLGGVYAYTVTNGGTTYTGTVNSTVNSGAATGACAISGGIITFIAPSNMGSGYTSAPTVVIPASAGTQATATCSINPNINSAGATTTTLGANGGAGVSPAATRGTGTGTWTNGGTTITLTAANSVTVVGNYITGSGIPVGTTVTAVSGTAIGSTITLSAPTTAAATATGYVLFKATGAAGGAGGAGGNGGAGGAATSNAYNQTFAAGNPGVGIGGGGSGAISETGTQSGGAGAAGQVILTFTTTSVELTNIDAKRKDKSTLITWTTASEKDNAQFNVEQSTDGKTFKTIGEVKGNGTTASANNYSFEHSTPAVGVNYYRLKQLDYNGTETYSAVRSVVFGNNGLVVKNTLVKDVVTVIVNEEATSTVNIFNISGQQVMTAKAQGEQTLDVSTLPPGIYMIRTTTGDVSRFVKQ